MTIPGSALVDAVIVTAYWPKSAGFCVSTLNSDPKTIEKIGLAGKKEKLKVDPHSGGET